MSGWLLIPTVVVIVLLIYPGTWLLFGWWKPWTDPFDTVRDALGTGRFAHVEPALAALASIEERLKEAERLLEIEQERGVVRRIRAEAAERELASAKVEIIDWKLAKADSDRERDALQHIIDCADTPLMRDVLEAKLAAERRVEEMDGERMGAEAKIDELEAALREIASCEQRIDGDVVSIAQSALANGEQAEERKEQL